MNGTKGAAKRDAMGELHDELAKKLTDAIKNGETVVKAGEEVRVPVSAAMLNVARGFLKDNHIECDEGLTSRPVGELSETVSKALAKMEEEDAEIPEFTN